MENNLKILPKSIELEQAVLGALLVDYSNVGETLELLNHEVFTDPRHQEVFKSIYRVFNDSKPIDVLIIVEDLTANKKIKKAGGYGYVIELTQKIASSAHIEHHSRVLMQKYMQRSIIKMSTAFLQNAYKEDVDVFELSDKAYSFLNEISEFIIKKNEVKFEEIVTQVKEKAVRIYKGEVTPGLLTPISKLSSNTGGWRDGELIILAARPGMGKTAFALKCASYLANMSIPTAFFCLEMSNETLVSRVISMEAKVPIEKFNKKGLGPDDEKVVSVFEKRIKDMPFYIDDTTSLSIEQLQIKAKRLKSTYDIKILFVDYLQLMSSSVIKGNREQEISKISRGLKTIAKDLKIPVIALSQLSRAVETRGGSKRPLLSDLRESGAIEQDADMVGFLYRPEYYGMDEWDDDERSSCVGEAEIIIAKNRNGGLVRVRMNFEGEFTLFSDIENNQNEIREELLKIEPNEAFGI